MYFGQQINFADAQQALGFLAPQLLRINTEIDYQEYPDFDFAQFMFVNTDGGMWAYGSIFYSGDIAGRPEWLDGAGFDMPYADVSTMQFLQENHLAGIGYEWHRQELERAAQMGRQLGSEKARAARTVADAKIYSIAFRGDARKNMTGLVNNAAVPTANVPADGAGGLTTFASKTTIQINRDINAVLNAPFNSTMETKRANTLLLPTTRLQYLASTPFQEGSDTTIMAFIKANNSYTLETGQQLTIRGSRELETAGAGGTARMMSYANQREVLQLYLPGPHEFFEPFQKGSFTWEIPGLFNIGGVEFRRPKGAAYRDGI
jgi:hypothetical protein